MPLTVMRMARPSPSWQETYVRVKKGQRLVVDAEGAWSPDLGNRTGWCGGDGLPNTLAQDGYVMPGANIGALIGRIGSEGRTIAFGHRYDNVVDEEGVVYIAMNDHPDHNNQAGQLLAQFIVLDPGE